jgi:hypothetical protein
MTKPPDPTERRSSGQLEPELRIAAAVIFQAFKDTMKGPQSQREGAEAWLRSEDAALWLSVLELPAENIERALKNFPDHRYRSNVQFNPAAARKAYQTRLKRGNWMKPWEEKVPSATSR